MAKKGTKIALTYIITILVTLVIIGGIGYLLLDEIMTPKDNNDRNAPTFNLEQMGQLEEYVPSAVNNKTTLLIFDSEKRMSGCCFMAVRMIADERYMVIMPIPADTYANVNGSENSIYEFYRLGGTTDAVKAVESATGVKMDYYLKLNNESFTMLVDIFGSVDFNVPYNLVYTNPNTGEETIMRQGEATLDSQLLRKVITYPLYNSGEEYRSKMLGVAVSDLINKNVEPDFSNHIDDYFSSIINSSIETNFTAYDYEEQADAMKYIAGSDERICQLVTVSGEYNENSLLVLDKSFLKSLTDRFKLNDLTVE